MFRQFPGRVLVVLLIAVAFLPGCWSSGSTKTTPPPTPGTGKDPIIAMKTPDVKPVPDSAAVGESVTVEDLNKAISRQREAFSKQDQVANSLLEQWSDLVQQRAKSSTAADPAWDKDAGAATTSIASITVMRDTYREALSRFRYPLSPTALRDLKGEAQELDDRLETSIGDLKIIANRWAGKF